MPAMQIWLLMMLACGGGDSTPDSPERALSKPIAPVQKAKALKGALEAVEAPEEGWGAIFWRQGQAWKIGGGDIVASPTEAKKITASGEPNVCQGVAIKGAQKNAAVAIPQGTPMPKIIKTPAIRAHLVERAAWRLDEVLPPRDKYSSGVSSNAPSQQRGVSVGSVAKTRRHGAPPLLLATGVRDCTAAIAVLNSKSDLTLAYDRVSGICETLRVLPATQLDTNEGREFAAFNDTDVLLYRLVEGAGRVKLKRLKHWRCAAETTGG